VLECPLPSSCPFFLHFHPPCNIFLHLWLFFAIGGIHQEAQTVKFSCSCTSGFTDCSCLLPTFKFGCLLYFRTSQASIVFFHISKFNCNCTSGLLRLQLFSTFFLIFKFYVFFSEFFLFGYQHLIT
jgi:hypothetical protein